MIFKPRMLAAGLALAALIAPSMAQVAPPPPGKPEPAPEFRPPPPPPVRAQPRPRSVPAPDVDYEPIGRRDDDGKLMQVEEPVEYLAMSNNPLIDVPTLVRMAPYFYTRRMEVETAVIENLETLAAVEGGLIEQARTTDEERLREVTGRVAGLTSGPDLKPYLSTVLVEDGVLSPQVGALTQKIATDYQQAMTSDAMSSPASEDGPAPIDRMMHVVLRMSLSEHEYYYRRLMQDAADHFAAVMPQLGLDAGAAAAVKPLADQLENESDLDARAKLIREIFAAMPEDSRQQALRLTRDMRPEVDPGSLMPPLPEGAMPKEIDNQTRREIIFQLTDGGHVNTASLVE